MYRMPIYEVFLEDEKVFEGTRVQVFKHFGLSPSTSISTYSKYGHLLKDRYRVVMTDRYIDAYYANGGYHEKKLDYLVEHLSLYGNTVMRDDPTPYLEDLEELGFKVKVSLFDLNTSKEMHIDNNEVMFSPSRRVDCIVSHYIELIKEEKNE